MFLFSNQDKFSGKLTVSYLLFHTVRLKQLVTLYRRDYGYLFFENILKSLKYKAEPAVPLTLTFCGLAYFTQYSLLDFD